MSVLSLYLTFIKLRLATMIEYRGAFLGAAAAQAASYGAQMLLIALVVDRFGTISGWTSYETLFLYGLLLASYALAGFFLWTPTEILAELVRDGGFDDVLIRPLNPLAYLVCREFNYGYFTHLFLSGTVLALCVSALDIPLNGWSGLFLLTTLLGGALIHAAGFLIIAIPAFWLVQSEGMEVAVFGLRMLTRFPVSIYHRSVQVLLTLVLPFAFVNFFPAQVILGKDDLMAFPSAFRYMTPLVGLVCFALAYWLWTWGIRHYESTGS